MSAPDRGLLLRAFAGVVANDVRRVAMARTMLVLLVSLLLLPWLLVLSQSDTFDTVWLVRTLWVELSLALAIMVGVATSPSVAAEGFSSHLVSTPLPRWLSPISKTFRVVLIGLLPVLALGISSVSALAVLGETQSWQLSHPTITGGEFVATRDGSALALVKAGANVGEAAPGSLAFSLAGLSVDTDRPLPMALQFDLSVGSGAAQRSEVFQLSLTDRAGNLQPIPVDQRASNEFRYQIDPEFLASGVLAGEVRALRSDLIPLIARNQNELRGIRIGSSKEWLGWSGLRLIVGIALVLVLLPSLASLAGARFSGPACFLICLGITLTLLLLPSLPSQALRSTDNGATSGPVFKNMLALLPDIRLAALRESLISGETPALEEVMRPLTPLIWWVTGLWFFALMLLRDRDYLELSHS